MSSLRVFKAQDILKLNLANFDSLTENYGLDFYLQYLTTWQDLFTVAVDIHENVVGYGEQSRIGEIASDEEYNPC